MALRYVYNTSGGYVAFESNGHLFNPDSEWLGYIVNGNEVYQTEGFFVGYLLDDDRVARHRYEPIKPRRPVPPHPVRPLRPMRPRRRLRMPPLPHPYEDIFEGVKGKVTRLPTPREVQAYDSLEGARIVAADGMYLGTISRDKYREESISNKYGRYGSQYEPTSIFNQYGPYGSKYGPYSAFNPYSAHPPRIVKGERVIGYLTSNRHFHTDKPNQQVVDPTGLELWLNIKFGV